MPSVSSPFTSRAYGFRGQAGVSLSTIVLFSQLEFRDQVLVDFFLNFHPSNSVIVPTKSYIDHVVLKGKL